MPASEFSSFRTDILPILTKAGCNAGACHGAATGQGGFKLSLLGYDPEADYHRITRELSGRRLDLDQPGRSLFLQKPTHQIDHEGGRRLAVDSENYRRLIDWIEARAPYGQADLQVSRIEVTPADQRVDSTNETVQLRVTAVLSDGSRRDATALALYTSNDDAIAKVSKSGQVTTRGRGLTSIMVRYSGQVAAARVTIPFAAALATESAAPEVNLIDRHVARELQRLGLPMSGLSGDAEFLRRAHLDLIGRLPSSEEARAFLQRPATKEDRERVITSLLQREEFVDFWTMRFADLLLISGQRGNEEGTRAYHFWLRNQIARNVPWNQTVRTLLTANGSIRAVGPANFFTLAKDPRNLAEHVGRMFLGSQIACARCHAHPTDRWTQEDYHRFAAYFARVTTENDAVTLSPRGEVELPKTGRPLMPRPLGAEEEPETQNPERETNPDRRVALADWLTTPDNPMFSRTLVNRVWKFLLGRGLVEPVDDLRPTNPATYPALLDALAIDFVEQGYDLRRLIHTIVSSRTYQLASQTTGLNALDDRFYSHALLKELPAQVFVDAISDVTGVAERFTSAVTPPRAAMREMRDSSETVPPSGTRAVELVGSQTPSYALDVLGRCSREQSCDVPGASGGGLAAALHLINGATINDKLGGGIVSQLLSRQASAQVIVEELYLRSLTRRPGPDELEMWQDFLAHAPNRGEAAEDLLWTLLNSREFAFNH